jgi:hypothetical protein
MHNNLPRGIRFSVIFSAMGSAALNAIVAVFSRTLNPLVPNGGLIPFIGIANAWIILGLMSRSNAGLTMPPNPKAWALRGGAWGVLWGIYPGVVLGWGGGPSGPGWGDMPQLGLWPWILICVGISGLADTVWVFTLARFSRDEGKL